MAPIQIGAIWVHAFLRYCRFRAPKVAQAPPRRPKGRPWIAKGVWSWSSGLGRLVVRPSGRPLGRPLGLPSGRPVIDF